MNILKMKVLEIRQPYKWGNCVLDIRWGTGAEHYGLKWKRSTVNVYVENDG